MPLRPPPGGAASASDIEKLGPPNFHQQAFNEVWRRWLYSLYTIVFGTATTILEAADMSNGWIVYAAGAEEPGFWKSAAGNVYLQGRISTGTVGTAAIVLPVGYRPAATLSFAVISNNALGQVLIDSAGNLSPLTPSVNTWVSLDGICFRSI